ncbi:MAG: putative Fimbral protein [Candidatus Saccharibacteria bacterium]|nr:putative Fimbral protein [Candidatus Saccharibacteria bacterium]
MAHSDAILEVLMLIYKKTNSGFTIVELLLVIVVIGILASITMVGYNGVQQRARNVARTDYASRFNDILEISLIKNTPAAMIAAMDHADGWDKACLGSGYTDRNGDARGDCAVFGGTSYIPDTATFNALLSQTALPSMAAYPPVTSTDGDITYGPFVNVETADGVYVIVLEYVLEGQNQKCALGPLIYQNGAVNTLTPTGNPNYTVSAFGVTECWVMVAKNV